MSKDRQKRTLSPDFAQERPNRRAKLILDEDEPESGSDNSSQKASDGEGNFLKINEEYARRFAHNKKREELHRLQEKYGKSKVNGSHAPKGDAISGSDTSSESESEDDEGQLATKDLDAEISATLRAIRSKDPRVYDAQSVFYTKYDPSLETTTEGTAKPMFLKDYHRKNLLGGLIDEERPIPVPSYAQEQEDLKNSLVKEMHAVIDTSDQSASGDEDAGLLVPKSRIPIRDSTEDADVKEMEATTLDITGADEDPERFLDDYMASRAWLPTERPHPQPFESEDEEEDQRAEDFEQAYNLRFEDPETANERLRTHARDAAAKYSVRREEPTSRKRVREAREARKAAERQEQENEKARLKKLKYDEIEEKVKKIKQAAGLRGKDIPTEQWAKVLEAEWKDEDWDTEMAKRFDDAYYADAKKHPKKPQWNDDIDINDIVPDFSDVEAPGKVPFDLAADEDDVSRSDTTDVESSTKLGSESSKSLSKKDWLRAQAEQKRSARKERQLISTLVDQDLSLSLPQSTDTSTPFRYRETSPTNFGMTPLDILMADDSQLNQYAGLKKLASFRDPEKKRKDKKRLGKKARLRMWRKDAFGSADGPDPDAFHKVGRGSDDRTDVHRDKAGIREGRRRRHRHKK